MKLFLQLPDCPFQLPGWLQLKVADAVLDGNQLCSEAGVAGLWVVDVDVLCGHTFQLMLLADLRHHEELLHLLQALVLCLRHEDHSEQQAQHTDAREKEERA